MFYKPKHYTTKFDCFLSILKKVLLFCETELVWYIEWIFFQPIRIYRFIKKVLKLGIAKSKILWKKFLNKSIEIIDLWDSIYEREDWNY